MLSSAAIYSAIVYAADNGADVINLSLGTTPGTPQAAVATMELAIQYARTKGVTVVVASGNNGVDIGVQPVWPANFSTLYDHVVTVGASTNSDVRASFSNYGSPVNLVAPGFFIYSTVPGSWNFMSGTSMATPVVAGAIADLIASGQVSSPAAIRNRLIERAKPTVAGPRLDLGLLLGVGVAPAVQVSYGGADRLVADTTGALSISVTASNLPTTVTRAQISLATNVGGEIYAVANYPVRFRNGSNTIELTSNDSGTFAPIAINDPAMLTLFSDQALRRIVITGRPDLGMPNFSDDTGRSGDFAPLSSDEIADLVALLASWREHQAPQETKTP